MPIERGSETERGSDCGEERGIGRVRLRTTRRERKGLTMAVMGKRVMTLLMTGDMPSLHVTYHKSAKPWITKNGSVTTLTTFSYILLHPFTIPKWWSFQVDNRTGQKLFQFQGTCILLVLYMGNCGV